MALVTPIHKNGSGTVPSNYRPISLTCKPFEHMIFHNLHGQVDNILHNSQNSFKKTLLGTTQLVAVFHDILTRIGKSKIVLSVILDFPKAFHVVNHGSLISKLK